MSRKQRYNIKQFKISDESSDVDPTVVSYFKERISDVLSKYEPKGASNCDETGLFYHNLQDRTLAQKGNKVENKMSGCQYLLLAVSQASCQCTGDSTRRSG